MSPSYRFRLWAVRTGQRIACAGFFPA